jgi:hypothetical protein
MGSFIGIRPVHQQQVDVVDTEITEAFVDRARKIVRVQILVRDLGAKKYLVTRDA